MNGWMNECELVDECEVEFRVYTRIRGAFCIAVAPLPA